MERPPDPIAATCNHCSWSAEHRAVSTPEELMEAVTFLRTRLIEHCKERHAEQFNDDAGVQRSADDAPRVDRQSDPEVDK